MADFLIRINSDILNIIIVIFHNFFSLIKINGRN